MNRQRFNELVEGHLLGCLDDREFAELEAILESDAGARAQMSQALRLDSYLCEASAGATESEVPRRRPRWWMAYLIAPTALAACLVVAFFLWRPSSGPNEESANQMASGNPSLPPANPTTQPIGKIASWSGTPLRDWQNRALAKEDLIGAGRFSMQSGIVNLQLDSGVRVIGTAPLQLAIVNPMEISCQLGEIRVHVPPEAYGFKVITSEKRITERGSEAVIDLTPAWNESNHARVFITDVERKDSKWVNYDDANLDHPTSTRQQWQWLNFSEQLDRIPSDARIKSASLRWFGNPANPWMNPDVRWSVFAVQGTDRGRSEIISAGGKSYERGDIPSYFATHKAYGAVTTGEIIESSWGKPIRWDVTELVQAWQNDPAAKTAGQLMILNDRNRLCGPPNGQGHGGPPDYIRWGTATESTNVPGAGPVLVVEILPPSQPEHLADSLCSDFIVSVREGRSSVKVIHGSVALGNLSDSRETILGPGDFSHRDRTTPPLQVGLSSHNPIGRIAQLPRLSFVKNSPFESMSW